MQNNNPTQKTEKEQLQEIGKGIERNLRSKVETAVKIDGPDDTPGLLVRIWHTEEERYTFFEGGIRLCWQKNQRQKVSQR